MSALVAARLHAAVPRLEEPANVEALVRIAGEVPPIIILVAAILGLAKPFVVTEPRKLGSVEPL